MLQLITSLGNIKYKTLVKNNWHGECKKGYIYLLDGMNSIATGSPIQQEVYMLPYIWWWLGR